LVVVFFFLFFSFVFVHGGFNLLSNCTNARETRYIFKRGEYTCKELLWEYDASNGAPYTFCMAPSEMLDAKSWFYVRAAPRPPAITSMAVHSETLQHTGQLRAGDKLHFDEHNPITIIVTLNRAIDPDDGSPDELEGVNSALGQLTASWHSPSASGKHSVKAVELTMCSRPVDVSDKGKSVINVSFAAAGTWQVEKLGGSHYWLKVSSGHDCEAVVQVEVTRPADSYTYVASIHVFFCLFQTLTQV
jgi:hypothetical protein